MLMQESDWTGILHFNQNEKWGDWHKIDCRVIYELDIMRDFANVPFVIHCAYELSGHTTNSTHYQGLAIDGHFRGMPLIEQYLIAERFAWSGIGIYPDWNSPGLHLDMREGRIGKRWGQKKINGKTEYCKLDQKLLTYIIAKDV